MSKNLALLKAFDVIDAVADGQRTLKSISDTTGIPKSTIHRILNGLIESRYIREIDGIGMVLGTRMIQLGNLAQETMPLKDIAHPFLCKLADDTKETVHLAIRDEDEVFYLDKISGHRAIQLRSKIGDRLPMAITGVGKALMLDLPKTEQLRLINKQLSKKQDKLFKRIEEYKKLGYAFDLEDNEDLVHCVAVPIRGKHQKIIAAISITSIKEYLPIERMQTLVHVLLKCASDIERLL